MSDLVGGKFIVVFQAGQEKKVSFSSNEWKAISVGSVTLKLSLDRGDLYLIVVRIVFH